MKIKIEDKIKSNFSLAQTSKFFELFIFSILFLFFLSLITMNNGSCSCVYWLSIWGHKNVNVTLRKNTFGA